MNQSEKREKQKKRLLTIVDKLYKKDLEKILDKFCASKRGTKTHLKERVIGFIELQKPDIKWSELKKEIQNVFDNNPKIKKTPKKMKRKKQKTSDITEAVVDTLATITSNETIEPNFASIAAQMPVLNPIEDNNNYEALSYYNSGQGFRPLVDHSLNPLVSRSQDLYANGSHYPNPQQAHQPLPNPYNASNTSTVPTVPLFRPYSTIPNESQTSDQHNYSLNNTTVPNGTAYSLAQNPSISRPPPIPPPLNPLFNFGQPLNYSNNSYHTFAQNYRQNNYFPNPVKDVLNPDNFDAFLEQQKFLLSECSQSFQERNNDSDLHVSPEDFSFKSMPKYKVIKKLKETKTIAQLTDIGVEVEFNLEVQDFEDNYYRNETKEELLYLLSRKSYQIQLRFNIITDIQTSGQRQRDSIPEYLCIDVNDKQVFSYAEDNEFSGPFDLSLFCNFGKNKIKFWLSKEKFTFLLPCLYEIAIVSVESPETFLKRLNQNILQYLSSDTTINLIKSRSEQRLQDEALVVETNTKVKLICPLSCRRIEIPCRTTSCKHIECFDAFAFLKTNEYRYEWFCPICQKSADFESLRIDGYFTLILNTIEKNITEIFIKSDATYNVINENNSPLVVDLELEDSNPTSDECLLLEEEGVEDDDDCIILD